MNGRKSVQNVENWHQYKKLLGKKIETRHYEYSTLYPYPDKITNLILLSVLCSFSAFISLQSNLQRKTSKEKEDKVIIWKICIALHIFNKPNPNFNVIIHLLEQLTKNSIGGCGGYQRAPMVPTEKWKHVQAFLQQSLIRVKLVFSLKNYVYKYLAKM